MAESDMHDQPSTNDVLYWAEFACWTTLVLSPFLYWVNGPAVSADQIVVRTMLVTVACLGAIGLRVSKLFMCRRHREGHTGTTCEQQRKGFTLVELLVVVATIALLVAILLPAVNAAREASRRVICSNQLKQLGLAALEHESAHRFFPSGGWGYQWVGDPDRGFGREQPGGWMYSILPFIEQEELWKAGRRQKPEEKMAAVAQVVQTPMAGVNCPSRREHKLVVFSVERGETPWRPVNSAPLVGTTRSDYAINAGDVDPGGGPGPRSLAGARSFRWNDFRTASGLSYTRSQVAVARVTDGTSHTYLLGEKSVNLNQQGDQGDDQSLYVGYDYDTCRWTLPSRRPSHDRSSSPDAFGSIHASAFHAAFADGAIKAIDFDIDAELHRRLGNRHDGLSAAAY